MTRFFRYDLRTTDVAGARAFYTAVLGNEDARIFQLHEQAIARGARPHWLGYIQVDDVDSTAAAFVARGAMHLGPKWVNPEGLEAAIMRDPGGAVVALAKPPPAQRLVPNASAPGTSATEVGWRLLHTADVEGAKATYGELFRWAFKPPLDLGSLGIFHEFSWKPGEPPTGAMSDVSQRRGVHPHWLFHFDVPALEPALDAVHAAGGIVVARVLVPSGDHIAVCDDPQGAAFALRAPRAH
jgi:predicted enzyme related to lactoylglutathione lyase